jgi:hypothetical protein
VDRALSDRGVHSAEVTDKIALHLARFRDYFHDAHGHERFSGGHCCIGGSSQAAG